MENATCFFESDGVCRVIAVDKCTVYRKHICSFCKTQEEVEKGRKDAFARLNRLPLELQAYIAEKYYGGKKPWEAEG